MQGLQSPAYGAGMLYTAGRSAGPAKPCEECWACTALRTVQGMYWTYATYYYYCYHRYLIAYFIIVSRASHVIQSATC